MEHGVRPDLVPNEAVGEALAQAIIQRGVAGRRVLLLRSGLMRSWLVPADAPPVRVRQVRAPASGGTLANRSK
jgi:uroporphyrinogen-III synthase